MLCDGGGSNSASHYLFKEDLQRLVDRIGIEFRVRTTRRIPPSTTRLSIGCSRNSDPRVLGDRTSVELVKALMEKATTRTGLQVTVDILDKVCRRGGRCGRFQGDHEDRVR